jgi:hypothetical protein
VSQDGASYAGERSPARFDSGKGAGYIAAPMPVLRFIEPCLPSRGDRPPSGSNWIHEIKHDGYRLMARRDPIGIRLITRRGNDWSDRFPLVVQAVNYRVRSCLIDGEVVCCDERGWLPSMRSADAGTSPRRSSMLLTSWSWTARTCAASRSRCARRPWRASCGRLGTACA